jgi:hypothetical protein
MKGRHWRCGCTWDEHGRQTAQCEQHATETGRLAINRNKRKLAGNFHSKYQMKRGR